MNSDGARLAAPHAPEGMDEAEWRLRCELAACYQLTDLYGMSDLASTHISVALPGDAHHFLVNPLGVFFDEMTASALLKVDLEGRVVEGDASHLNPAGFVIHSAIHMAQTDLVCVMHSHTRANNAIAMQAAGLRPLSQKACVMMDFLGYHDYEGAALDEDERERLVRDLGPEGRVLILRNHGALTVGRTVGEAFCWMLRLETACRFQIDGQSGGVALHELSDATIAHTRAQGRRMLGPGGFMEVGRLEWPGLLRKLERERGTAYRT
ncbi:MAG TPA: class II aldolase/adducin family protein [Ramlibacter sp.]|uniref:class II aldolase/adducin family protein n=1 Tax=Ramlibacter sp. TaxID=1917967 RepID=UPI002C3500B1|nr:class II aldolase/adducin family protein [Ramlibacter sp.]HVZ45654.1 class II aldolase/adducin family protein [Ramlibacter sp.]